MKEKQIAVLGGGSWGTTIAALMTRNSQVSLWARSDETVNEINTKKSNSKYLSEIELPASLKATNDIAHAVETADLVVMAIPSQNFRYVLTQAKTKVPLNTPIISLTKGLELKSRQRMTEIVAEVMPNHATGVLTGPNLALEIIEGRAAASVIAMKNPTLVKSIQPLFNNGLYRVYTNLDVVGCELGGVLKNIIAIAVGMGDGLGAGDNTRASLITRGLAEITRLGVAMGGEPATFSGLAGIGDLIATCTSPQSRNRHVGIELAKGKTMEEIIGNMYMVAEGVQSAPAVKALAEQYQVEMPIVDDVYRVLTGETSARGIYKGLLRVQAGAESEPG